MSLFIQDVHVDMDRSLISNRINIIYINILIWIYINIIFYLCFYSIRGSLNRFFFSCWWLMIFWRSLIHEPSIALVISLIWKVLRQIIRPAVHPLKSSIPFSAHCQIWCSTSIWPKQNHLLCMIQKYIKLQRQKKNCLQWIVRNALQVSSKTYIH